MPPKQVPLLPRSYRADAKTSRMPQEVEDWGL